MKFADLHTHTTCSDGILAPAALVNTAAQAGLAALAITDHDTFDAIPDAYLAALKAGIELIPGVELTSRVENNEVHILAYFPHGNADLLAPILAHSRQIRAQRITHIVEALNKTGIPITADQILTVAGDAASVGRPHVARALVTHGHVRNTEEAFARFLRPGKPGYVERHRMTTAEAIGHVRRANGIPVLAHPGIANIRDTHIHDMRDQGLAGIEVWHPEHSAGQTARFQKLAADLGLLLTGGSDAHDDKPGVVRIPYELVTALKDHHA